MKYFSIHSPPFTFLTSGYSWNGIRKAEEEEDENKEDMKEEVNGQTRLNCKCIDE